MLGQLLYWGVSALVDHPSLATVTVGNEIPLQYFIAAGACYYTQGFPSFLDDEDDDDEKLIL